MQDNNNNDFNSALKVNDGIEQPPQVNESGLQKFLLKKPKPLTIDDYVNGIISGNRVILSKAITLIESTLQSHHELAQQIIEKCIPYSGKSVRIGITGVPGVGKSTFIEAFGKYITSLNKKVAVLAIDPSSQISKGSILGDKTRMEELSVDVNAFIRPSPSAGSLGGVARKTRETIILCEAAGFDVIFVETVGVGQSETAVHSMVDFFLLLMLSGAGDELQGIKRGIMEMADAILINKADGDNIIRAQAAKVQYQNALHLFPPTTSGWKPVSETCSAATKTGIDKVWTIIEEYLQLTKNNGYFIHRRNEQESFRMREAIEQALNEHFYNQPHIQSLIHKLEEDIQNQKITAYNASQRLLHLYFDKFGE